jgi:hypothetical protein
MWCDAVNWIRVVYNKVQWWAVYKNMKFDVWLTVHRNSAWIRKTN